MLIPLVRNLHEYVISKLISECIKDSHIQSVPEKSDTIEIISLFLNSS